MAWYNYWTKTPVTTIDDTHQFLISKTTGAADVTTWANIKAKLLILIQATGLDFSVKIKAPNGTATTEVVNFQQLDTKLNKSGGTMTGQLIFDDLGVNIPNFTGTFPTTASDPQGVDGDLIRSGKRLALKNVNKWAYIDFTDMP